MLAIKLEKMGFNVFACCLTKHAVEEFNKTSSANLKEMVFNNLSRRIAFIIVAVTMIFYLSTRLSVDDNIVLKRSKANHLSSNSEAEGGNDDFKTTMDRLNAIQATDDNSQLIGMIRKYFIESPSSIPYNLENPTTEDPSQGQARVIDNLLNQRTKGFFVECGANKGEEFSNSLFLERYRNWTGILIEANPTLYNHLRKKNRKSFTLNACLNSKPYPSTVTFLEDSWWGKIFEGNYSKNYRGIGGHGRFVQVQCFPLYSVLLALNQTRVDYFSLDVEGAENGVLNSIPWQKVNIQTLSVEYDKWPGGKSALKTYMKTRGYKVITEITKSASADVIFMKEGIP